MLIFFELFLILGKHLEVGYEVISDLVVEKLKVIFLKVLNAWGINQNNSLQHWIENELLSLEHVFILIFELFDQAVFDFPKISLNVVGSESAANDIGVSFKSQRFRPLRLPLNICQHAEKATNRQQQLLLEFESIEQREHLEKRED